MRNLFFILLVTIVLLPGCQQKTAFVAINANHDSAIIFLNDQQLGYTPLDTTVSPGPVLVKVKKEGFEEFIFSDTLMADSLYTINALLYTPEELEIMRLRQQEEELFKTQSVGKFTDFREKKSYKWVKIGQQIWMAENLAYKSPKCWAYDNNSRNISDYGYLYTWVSAQEACPPGWHIPTDAEWKQLSTYLGGDNRASEKLRERGFSHWIDGYYYRPIATNESGFTARPGGQRNDKGEFFTLGTYANFWSATAANETEGICFWLGYMGDFLSRDTRPKGFGLSVRCVKD